MDVYVSEKKIDQLIGVAKANNNILMEMNAKYARLSVKIEDISRRLKTHEFRTWSAARAALGQSALVWDAEYSKEYNFDELVQYLETNKAPLSVKPPPSKNFTSVLDDIHFLATRHTCLSHPFSISCGPGWAGLIRGYMKRIFKLAIEKEEKIGIFQICERDGRLNIEVETVGISQFFADELRKIADCAKAESEAICEICGDPGSLRNVNGVVKCRCVGHFIHGDG